MNFEPDGERPIYCKNCLKKARRGELPLGKKKKPVEEKEPEKSNIKPVEQDIPKQQDQVN